MLKHILTLLIFCAAFAAPWLAVAEEERLPHEIIETAANSIVGEIKGRKDYLNENREELYKLINEILMPHFDMRYAGRLVLGKHWKSAPDEQRNRFINVFYEFLLQSYANGVLRFDEGEIVVYPVDIATDDKRTVVKTDMRMDDGSQVPVNYSMRNSKAGWRVYDVQIEGVSYIRNYRNQFNAEISEMGIEAVIERLQSETKKSAAMTKSQAVYSSNSSSKSSS
jgi:phospholipid transport system substrate-binding protein